MEFTVTYAVVALAALLASGLLGSVESALAPISRARVESMLKDDVPGSRALMRVVDSRANQVNMLVMVRTVLDVTCLLYTSPSPRDRG